MVVGLIEWRDGRWVWCDLGLCGLGWWGRSGGLVGKTAGQPTYRSCYRPIRPYPWPTSERGVW